VQALGLGRTDGKVVLATGRGRALIFDLRSGQPVAEFRGPDGNRGLRPSLMELRRRMPGKIVLAPIETVALQPAGLWAASAWEDGSVDVWRVDDGHFVRALPPRGNPSNRVGALAFRPDGGQLAATYADGMLRLWSLGPDPDTWTHQDLKGGPQNATGLC